MLQKSLTKALSVLDLLASRGTALGVTEVASALSLHKSNVHDILSTFEHFHYVEQDSQTRRYRLSMRFMEIAHALSGRFPFRARAHALIEKLAEKCGEVVYFGVPYGHEVMYLDGAFPQKLLTMRPVTGMTASLHCTGIGKALLANYPEQELSAVLAEPLQRFTDHTITDPLLLKEELRRIKLRGYSVDDMEHEFGTRCVAVPVFDSALHLVGAISITGPSLRFAEGKIEEYAQLLKAVADELGAGI